MAATIADEIETRALPFIRAGMPRDKALPLAIAIASGRLTIVRG